MKTMAMTSHRNTMKASVSKQHPLLSLYDCIGVIICQPLMAFWSSLLSFGVQELPVGDGFVGTPNGTPNGHQFGVLGTDH